MLVSSYLVYTYHQNPIFSYHTQPPQNLIFRTNHSLFQNSGRPAQGDSRPMCTNVHSFVLAVDRFTNQSTDIGHLELTHLSGRPAVDRHSTDQTWSSRRCIGRPTVDRQSTASYNPSRPALDRPNLELSALFRSTGHLNQSTVSSFLGENLSFPVENPNSLETYISRLTLVPSRLETLSRLHY